MTKPETFNGTDSEWAEEVAKAKAMFGPFTHKFAEEQTVTLHGVEGVEDGTEGVVVGLLCADQEHTDPVAYAVTLPEAPDFPAMLRSFALGYMYQAGEGQLKAV